MCELVGLRGEAADGQTGRRLNDEQCRILIALEEGRFGVNKHGRYVIDYEERPDRKTREGLDQSGLIDIRWVRGSGAHWRITAKGKAALKAEMQKRAASRG